VRVLVACEFSGVVREAFNAIAGVRAVSCDLIPCDDGRTDYHYCGDVRDILGDGWDMMIAHPPCDYLTVSGNRWFSDSAVAVPGVLTGQARRDAQQQAVEFVRLLWEAPIPRVAIENPIGRLSTLWQKPSQVIQPFHFGDPFRKGTCLWLRGLPPLKPTSDLTDGEQACWLMPPSKDRKKFRSITYSGIAQAMADQWTQ